MTMPDASYFTDIRGAVYFPSRAYNAWQTWNELDEAEIDRDFGYAQDARLNALRMFTSYEYWQENGDTFFERFERVVQLAVRHGIRLMPVLFEDCGVDTTPQTRQDKNPHTAVCTCSPCRAVQRDPARYAEVDGYVDAFFERYGSDSRLLAIELMNEPHMQNQNVDFARYVVARARQKGGSVPLTIGCINLWHNLYFEGMLDVYQYHDNFPGSAAFLEMEMREARGVQEVSGKPCWLTEWQRVREKGPGWDVAAIPHEDTLPALHTLAETVYGTGMGSFFWSLMVKPAYLTAQRPNGTFNGLFHEDGSVYSLEDYQAIAGPGRTRPVTPTLPRWYLDSLEQAKG